MHKRDTWGSAAAALKVWQALLDADMHALGANSWSLRSHASRAASQHTCAGTCWGQASLQLRHMIQLQVC